MRGSSAFLPLVEKGARDERNFVKKGVSWALPRSGGATLALHGAALALAGRLAASGEAPCRWVGQDARRDLAKPKVCAQLVRRGPT